MANYDLSILIPARNEMFLEKTIEDILSNIEGNTEIIAVLDGYKPDPPIVNSDPRVTLIYHPESVGQRAATNDAAKISKAKYVMKVDAHCSFDRGFDRKMVQEMHDDWTMVPQMRNLHAFDWVCKNGHRRYQGPSGPCAECGEETTRDIVWRAKDSPKSVSYCFDSTPHFQYFGDYSKRPEGQGDITESMSLQGSCFMLTREKYWELDICDENFGSWGSQGIEVAAKTWLSGGRVMVNKKTWYAHMFRTQGGDFSFPYPISGRQQQKAKEFARDLFFNNNWPKQTRPLSWLIQKFWPVKGWTEEDLQKLKENKFEFKSAEETIKQNEAEPTAQPQALEPTPSKYTGTSEPTKGIIYYTDSELPDQIANPVRKQLKAISEEKNIPIISSSLKPLDFGEKNVCLNRQRGIITLFTQILAALEASTAEIIFFCEHDVLYHPTHFDFVPKRKLAYYYNINVWKVRFTDGHALRVDNIKQLSGLCGYRKNLIRHYKRRLEIIEKRRRDIIAAGKPLENEGVSKYMGYEPGMHSEPRGVDNYKVKSWRSEYPNIDIRHDNNFTKSRWKKEEFKDKKYTAGWTESTADKIPGWKRIVERFKTEAFVSIEKLPEKGIIFYTDNAIKLKIAHAVQKQLKTISDDKQIPIVSASLKRMSFGNKNIYFPSLKRSPESMVKQILGALENSKSEIIFFCEHDVLYHPSHFDFNPPDRDTFYYNQNVWWLRTTDGHALHYDVNQLSGLCGYREDLLTHFQERYDIIRKIGYSTKMGYEPMTHNRVNWDNKFKLGAWKSEYPNIDIKHEGNLTGHRWKKEEFRNQQLLVNWIESDEEIPGWGRTKEIINNF
ncbi:glycosyltransferase family 2 protein [Candidatus Microgenomates bacterium]|nr:MAG: glycosyltransferase family 2 protein [Candidatus Microgenomates bacterium]